MLPPPTRESVSVDAIPIRPIRAIAKEAVADIDVSLARMAAFGVSVSMSSRLHTARTILDKASQSGMLAPIHRGDTLGLRALETALDFHDIANSLPSSKDSAVRKAIEQAMAGELDPSETLRGPLQLQSQLVIRAAFVHGGAQLLRAEKPRPGRPQPDVVLANGTMAHPIEVKRPQAAKNILSSLLRRRQISSGVSAASAESSSMSPIAYAG